MATTPHGSVSGLIGPRSALLKPSERRRPRWVALLATAAVEAGVLALLVLGLAPPAALREGVSAALTAVNFAPPPPPPHHTASRSAAAAPPAPRAHALPVAAPSPKIAIAPPIAAAPRASTGAAPRSGAALAGTGSGAGGAGNGTGAGGNGDGDGNGDGGAEWISGRITDGDYPAAAREAGAQGTAGARITVAPNGRASGCAITHSSGNADLDDATCRLVLRRFRFRPAEDAEGRPESGTVDYDQEWSVTGYQGL